MRARHAAQTQFRLPSRRSQLRAALALAAALVLATGAAHLFAPPALVASTTDTLSFLQQQRDACQVMLDSGGTKAQKDWARACIANAERAIAALLASPLPSSSPSPTASSTPTPAPTTPPPTTAPPSPTASPTPAPTTPPATTPAPSPSPGGWPGPDNTGVPAGVTLTPYTGPCTITVAGTVIDSKLISCDIEVAAANVTITRSWVDRHTVHVDAATAETTPRLAISDSLIDAGQHPWTGLSEGLFVATRMDIIGGNRGVLCAWWCTLRDSWVHGTYVESDWHASAVRAERYSTIVHNTLACDWLIPTVQDGGCSADLTGYPDFAAPHDWLIQNNLFVANPTGAAFCAYGGSSGGKPFSSDPLTGTNIVFRDNVFQRGANRQCAAYGPIDSFNPSRPGALWQNNLYDDGTVVAP